MLLISQVLGQPVRAHAVNDAEVDGLGLAPQIVGDHLGKDLKYLGRRAAVDILVFLEGLDQNRVLGAVGQNAQLDLGVVGREHLPALAGDERLPDLAALLGADGDVLQIGVAAAQPAGNGDGLVERGMDTSRLGVNHLQKRVGVGGFELRQGTVAQNQGR